jgi:hypothetical protein
MNKDRYFLEHTTSKRPKVADMTMRYHAVDCGEGFIFGLCSLTGNHLNTLWDHPDIFLFPSTLDRRPVKYWLEQQKMPEEFWTFLTSKYGIVDSDCGRDALIKISDHFDIAILELSI